MDIKELLVEGTTKKVHATSQSDQVIVEFHEKASGKGAKKAAAEKAAVNNAVSSFLFEYLESFNVPTHFVKKLDEKSFLANRMDMIPMIVAVYNIASKDLAERLGIEEGKVLEFPIVEMYYKDAKRKFPMINEYHAYALGLCDRKEMTSITRIATKVNAVLKSFLERKQLRLVRLQMEFGRQQHQIVLGDEISLDTMLIWPEDQAGQVKPVDASQMDLNYMREIKARILGER
ncbi:MAG: phosphoribosylaminoimidazolesuccinocarboxamide synthase [Calditrichaeota bacterium]|nr:MAG: phosphoribosylaminoimidazolesuccinocarboxamide synthase [Calditrichota bacterium]